MNEVLNQWMMDGRRQRQKREKMCHKKCLGPFHFLNSLILCWLVISVHGISADFGSFAIQLLRSRLDSTEISLCFIE